MSGTPSALRGEDSGVTLARALSDDATDGDEDSGQQAADLRGVLHGLGAVVGRVFVCAGHVASYGAFGGSSAATRCWRASMSDCKVCSRISAASARVFSASICV
jgi:hypothetical protein